MKAWIGYLFLNLGALVLEGDGVRGDGHLDAGFLGHGGTLLVRNFLDVRLAVLVVGGLANLLILGLVLGFVDDGASLFVRCSTFLVVHDLVDLSASFRGSRNDGSWELNA